MSNGHPGRSKSSERVPPNPSFEEYERPKRRNRALEKKSLSGFVKSNAKEKEKKTSETQVKFLFPYELYKFLMSYMKYDTGTLKHPHHSTWQTLKIRFHIKATCSHHALHMLWVCSNFSRTNLQLYNGFVSFLLKFFQFQYANYISSIFIHIFEILFPQILCMVSCIIL